MRGDAAWRARGHAPGHPAMPNACLLGANNLLFQKPHFFGNHSKFVGKQQPRPRHAARPRQPHGVLPRPRHAAKPKAAPWACCHGQGMQPGLGSQGQGMLQRLRQPHGQAAKAKACSEGQGSPHGRAAKAKACTSHAAKAKAAPMGVLPRPSHAQATQPRPRQPPWAGCQGQGMQRRPHGRAAKAKSVHKPCCQGQGSPMACCQGQGMHKPRSQGQGSLHGQAAKAKACSQGQGSPHGRAAKAKACTSHAAKAKAAPMGRLPRPRHAAKAPWACCQGQVMHKPCSQGQGSPHGRAAKAKSCTSHAAKAKAAPMGRLPRPRHAAKAHGRAAKAKSCTSHAAKAKAAPMGVLPRPRHAQGHAAKAKAGPWAGCQGQGSPMGVLPRPGHAQGMQPGPRQPRPRQQPRPRPRRAAKAKAVKACISHAAKAKAAPMGMLPRPRHAQACTRHRAFEPIFRFHRHHHSRPLSYHRKLIGQKFNDASPARWPCDPSSYHESAEQRAEPASAFYLINASLPEVGDQPGSIPRRCRRRPEAQARPRARKGADERGDRAGQSDDARLVRWQRGPEAPNPHNVLHPRPRARPRGPQRQRGGEARVGREDGFEVLPTPRKEHRLGTNQLEGRVPSRQVHNTGTRIAFEASSDARNSADWEHAGQFDARARSLPSHATLPPLTRYHVR
ncbi:hypothetical protein CMV_022459 [Castanea mollissima]|uniref:Uncharacterized protein n=1 Tax=Castanea mollissima TaxID=60419 RepID=A0A8J4VEC1_9ROSI|nr:hypothetical protein CMV_022459 [Castanea mollissima]